MYSEFGILVTAIKLLQTLALLSHPGNSFCIWYFSYFFSNPCANKRVQAVPPLFPVNSPVIHYSSTHHNKYVTYACKLKSIPNQQHNHCHIKVPEMANCMEPLKSVQSPDAILFKEVGHPFVVMVCILPIFNSNMASFWDCYF